eukprot:3520256-Lingulodinium_polyedra.AAC.1
MGCAESASRGSAFAGLGPRPGAARAELGAEPRANVSLHLEPFEELEDLAEPEAASDIERL